MALPPVLPGSTPDGSIECTWTANWTGSRRVDSFIGRREIRSRCSIRPFLSTTNSEGEKLDRLLDYLNWTMDGEGLVARYFGEEGVLNTGSLRCAPREGW